MPLSDHPLMLTLHFEVGAWSCFMNPWACDGWSNGVCDTTRDSRQQCSCGNIHNVSDNADIGHTVIRIRRCVYARHHEHHSTAKAQHSTSRGPYPNRIDRHCSHGARTTCGYPTVHGIHVRFHWSWLRICLTLPEDLKTRRKASPKSHARAVIS